MFDTRSGFWLMASIVIVSVLATAAVILFAPDAELTYSTFDVGDRLPDGGHPAAWSRSCRSPASGASAAA